MDNNENKLRSELGSLYEQPFSIVVNELGEIAVVCGPCTSDARKSSGHADALSLMRPVGIGFETAARCENCGALGPMISIVYVDDGELDPSFGESTVIFGSEPTRAPESWEQGSVTGTP